MRTTFLSAVTLSLLASGCNPKPPQAGSDPLWHQRYVLAARADGSYVVVERLGTQIRLLLCSDAIPAAQECLPQAPLPAPLAARLAAVWQTRARATSTLRESNVGMRIDRYGFVWLESEPVAQLSTREGVLTVANEQVRIEGEGDVATVVPLGSSPDAVLWLSAPGLAYAGLELAYDGEPRTRAAFLVDLHRARAKLLAKVGFTHHERGDYRGALAAWQKAAQLDPTQLVIRYDIACALARMGRAEDAVAALAKVVSQGGDRYRRWAAHDPDLASLHQSQAYWRLVRPSSRKAFEVSNPAAASP